MSKQNEETIYKILEEYGTRVDDYVHGGMEGFDGIENGIELIKEFESRLEAYLDHHISKAVIEELRKVMNVCEADNSEFGFNLANAIEDKIEELKAKQESKE